MNKRKLHHAWRQLQKFSLLYFVGAFLLFGIVAAFALRSNNQHMIVLKNAVFEADKQDGDVETALRNLREYVYDHMNTNLTSGTSPVKPPIQLKYRYDRLVAAAETKADAVNATLYNDAQKFCETTQPESFYGAGRLPCVRSYLDSHGAVIPPIQPIPAELYQFDFLSPSWTPDLAGWSVVLALITLILLVIRITGEIWLRVNLKRHQ